MRRLGTYVSTLIRGAWLVLNRKRFARRDGDGRPRILIDVSVIVRHDAKTGIQRVVRAIWSELASRRHARFDFVPVYAGVNHGYCIATLNPLKRQVGFTGHPAAMRRGDKFLGLDLTAHYLPNCVEQIDAWRSAGGTIHAVIYDLLPLTRSDWFNASTRAHFDRWFTTVSSKADQLLCISDHVAAQVRRRLGERPTPEVGRVFLSGDISGSRPSAGRSDVGQSLLSQMEHGAWVLMVGTVEPRKGYNAVLDAFELLWRNGVDSAPHLIIVGKAGWKTEGLQARLRNHRLAGRTLHWLTDVSDEELDHFYRRCSMVLVASRDEGFGLPLSEAAFHRCWVLARDLAVFREQQLTNVCYFAEDDPEKLGASILATIDLSARTAPPEQTLPSWSDCIDRLLIEIGADEPSYGRSPKTTQRMVSGL